MIREPTHDIFTSGIVNVPLSKELKDSRYTFFELDTKNKMILRRVLDWYIERLGSVYVHETFSGYHFINLKPIDKKAYGEIIRPLKQLNPLCPMTTLRLLPNKWKGEAKYWLQGGVMGLPEVFDGNDLHRFRFQLEHQNIWWIKARYQVVHYRFNRKEVTA